MKHMLVNDIDMSESVWMPIGVNSSDVFTGVFDWQGYSINNLTTIRSFYNGLFGYTKNATIKNVGMEDTDIRIAETRSENTTGWRSEIGALVGYSENSNINNCYITGTVLINITYISSSANLLYYYVYVGGIMGANSVQNSSINNCYNTGSVNITYLYTNTAAIQRFLGAIVGASFDYSPTKYNYWDVNCALTSSRNYPVPNENRLNIGNFSNTATLNTLTSDQMKVKESYVGFDFNSIWGFKSGENSGYPILRAFYVDVTGVTLNKSSLTLEAGNTETLTATVVPAGATNKNVTWSSNDESIVTVSDGLVTAIRKGTVSITAATQDAIKPQLVI